MLGDAHAERRKKNTRIIWATSLKNKPYLDYIYKVINSYTPCNKPKISYRKHKNGTIYSSIRFSTKTHQAFNPIHDGHRGMINSAREMLGQDVTLELSIRNVDKPPLDFLTMSERCTDEYELVFSNAPTFAEKSAIFPDTAFIVGLDTIVRIDEPRYYGSETVRNQALATMAARGVRFLVFGRQTGDSFNTLTDVSLSKTLEDMCSAVTEDQFRHDISSTEIRSR